MDLILPHDFLPEIMLKETQEFKEVISIQSILELKLPKNEKIIKYHRQN